MKCQQATTNLGLHFLISEKTRIPHKLTKMCKQNPLPIKKNFNKKKKNNLFQSIPLFLQISTFLLHLPNI